MEKDNGAALETPSLSSLSSSHPLLPTRDAITEEEKMDRNDNAASETLSFSSSSSSTPPVAAAM